MTIVAENEQKIEAKYDVKEPIRIADESYWVGNREGSLLENNVYLRVFKGEGQTINLMIDPGPPSELLVISKKVGTIIGDIKNINLAFINHPDPDVAYNARYLQKMNPGLSVLCSEDTWRLAKFYDLNPKRYLAVESFQDLNVKLATNHAFSFVPSPFCHYRGSTMLYDRETRVLYTGDLFGGISYVKDFYVDERHWEGIKTYHEIYMPAQEAIKLAIHKIRALDPPPLILAPQHGSVITGQWVNYYLERLESLPVGIDLLTNNNPKKDNYIAALNQLLLELSHVLGPEKIVSAMRSFQGDGTFANMIHMDSSRGVVDILVDPKKAIDTFIKSIKEQAADKVNLVEVVALKVLCGRYLPLPDHLRAKHAKSSSLLS